ncbi:hypothetical protein PHBOTO_006151 [Pseudozyma hubeiensis]|nr:hypothetical protein PHBOTO_006151 [Pseudozyma hubeiensis]
MKEAFSTPLQGYDALRILTQILSFQTIHYLILATLLPPFLAIFAETSSLMFEGGPTQVGMVFDWRQLAGQPTYDWVAPKSSDPKGWLEDGRSEPEGQEVVVDPAVLVKWNLDNVWLDVSITGDTLQGKVLDHDDILRFKTTNTSSPTLSTSEDTSPTISVQQALEHWEYSHTRDSHRSTTLIFTWLLTIPLDILLLVYLVRRPTHILDHALTFHLLNFAISTWYTGAVPKGLKWWLTMLIHAGVLVVWSEQLAIKREMGRSVGYGLVGMGDEDAERGGSKIFDVEEESERFEMKPL